MYLVLDGGKQVELSAELAEQLSEVISAATKEESKDTGFFEGKEGKNCWVVCSDGIFNEASCNESRELLNEFTSREFAEKIRNRQLLERKLIKFSLEHDGDKIDWNDDIQDRYVIGYDYCLNNFDIIPVISVSRFGCPVFYSQTIAEQVIKTFHDDLIKYFTEWRIL